MSDLEAAEFDDELLSAYLDDELAPAERARVESRIAADPATRQLLDELRAVSQAVKGVPRATLDADLRDTILERAEREMLVPGERALARGRVDSKYRMPIGRSRRAWAWAGAALAAGILLMVFVPDSILDSDLPKTVAKRQAPALDGRMSPQELRAAEDVPKAGAEVVALPTTAPPARSAAPPIDSLVKKESLAKEEPAGGGLGGAARGSILNQAGELLVVHVNAKAEAIQNRALDQLLLKHQIEVEDESIGKAAAPAVQAVDVVLVQAAPEQIRSCLAEMDADRANYLGIAVNDELAATEQARAANEPATDLKQFNRGSVPAQQSVQLAPNNNYYVELGRGRVEVSQAEIREGTSESVASRDEYDQLANTTSGVQPQSFGADGRQTTGGIEVAPLSTQPTTRQFSAEDSASAARRARAQTDLSESLADAYEYSESRYDLPRRAMQKLATKADMLQVLFILQANAEPAAAAAAPVAEPAGP